MHGPCRQSSLGCMGPMGTRMIGGMHMPVMSVAPWQKIEVCEMLGLEPESGRPLEDTEDESVEVSASQQDERSTDENERGAAQQEQQQQQQQQQQQKDQNVEQSNNSSEERNRYADLTRKAFTKFAKLDQGAQVNVGQCMDLMQDAEKKLPVYVSKLTQKLPQDYPHLFARRLKNEVVQMQQAFSKEAFKKMHRYLFVKLLCCGGDRVDLSLTHPKFLMPSTEAEERDLSLLRHIFSGGPSLDGPMETGMRFHTGGPLPMGGLLMNLARYNGSSTEKQHKVSFLPISDWSKDVFDPAVSHTISAEMSCCKDDAIQLVKPAIVLAQRQDLDSIDVTALVESTYLKKKPQSIEMFVSVGNESSMRCALAFIGAIKSTLEEASSKKPVDTVNTPELRVVPLLVKHPQQVQQVMPMVMDILVEEAEQRIKMTGGLGGSGENDKMFKEIICNVLRLHLVVRWLDPVEFMVQKAFSKLKSKEGYPVIPKQQGAANS